MPEDNQSKNPTAAIRELAETIPGYHYDPPTATAYRYVPPADGREPSATDIMTAHAIFEKNGVAGSLPLPSLATLPDGVTACPYYTRAHNDGKPCRHLADGRCALCATEQPCIYPTIDRKAPVDMSVVLLSRVYAQLIHQLGAPRQGGKFGAKPGECDPSEVHYAAKIIVGHLPNGIDLLTYVKLERCARPLTSWDICVMNAVYDLTFDRDKLAKRQLVPSRTLIPLEEIARVISKVPHELQHRHAPSADFIDKIRESLIVLQDAIFSADYTQPATAQPDMYGLFKNPYIRRALLPSSFSGYRDADGIHECIKVYDYCPLLEYSQLLREFVRIPFKAIHSEAHTPRLSPTKAVIEQELLRRVVIARRARNKNLCAIDWARFCKELDLPATQKEGTRTRETAGKILDAFVDKGHLISWAWVKEGRLYRSIRFVPNPKTTIDAPASNEPQNH